MPQSLVAMVTGASSGIGRATVLQLAQKGYSVIAIGRRQERLESLSKEFRALTSTSQKSPIPQSQQIYCKAIDLREEDFVRAFADLSEPLNRLSVLINNAGLAKGLDSFQNSQWQDASTMLATNVSALMRMTHFCLPFLLKQKQADVINIGSVAGRWAYKGGAAYCASKFAVRGFSEALRADLNGTQVRVTNVEPGMVETEFSKVRLNDDLRAKEVYKGMTPLGAEDIAETILWCLSRPPHVSIQEVVIYPTDQASPYQVHRSS